MLGSEVPLPHQKSTHRLLFRTKTSSTLKFPRTHKISNAKTETARSVASTNYLERNDLKRHLKPIKSFDTVSTNSQRDNVRRTGHTPLVSRATLYTPTRLLRIEEVLASFPIPQAWFGSTSADPVCKSDNIDITTCVCMCECVWCVRVVSTSHSPAAAAAESCSVCAQHSQSEERILLQATIRRKQSKCDSGKVMVALADESQLPVQRFDWQTLFFRSKVRSGTVSCRILFCFFLSQFVSCYSSVNVAVTRIPLWITPYNGEYLFQIHIL